MCGILGILYKDLEKKVTEDLVKKALMTINHRGPNDEGIFIDRNIGLGHRRLSIIDLSDAGHQPMTNEDNTLWIVFNGEIYNFQELRNELKNKGHSFKSNTDTEVIIHSYEEWGRECINKLRGMFAFAIFDKRNRSLFIARDRLGIKPLYFYNDENVFIFSSEIKAILKTGFINPEVNKSAIDFYITLGYVPAPETLFKKIFKLQPAHYIIVNTQNITKYQYWDLSFSDQHGLSWDKACENLHNLLLECVKSHLISDVPLGVFLSGGIDSSTVVAFMNKIGTPVKTFSVGYEDAIDTSELDFARKIAKKFKTEHHEFILKPDDFFKSFETFLHFSEEPVVESAAIALYQLSKLAKEHVTVLLSGEGADEILGGYPLYWKMGNLEKVHKFFKYFSFIRKSGVFVNLLPEKYQKYLFWISVPFIQRYRTVSCDVVPNMKEHLYTKDFGKVIDNKVEYFFEKIFLNITEKSILQKMLYVDTKYWLPDDLLLKADKMTMANSIELRVPFLDHKLVEFACTLPDHFKVNRKEGKILLKKTVENLLPKEIVYRKKKGFPVPIDKWFSEKLYSKAYEVLLDKKTLERGYFNKRYIERILLNHKNGQDMSRRIFSLLIFELWHRKFID